MTLIFCEKQLGIANARQLEESTELGRQRQNQKREEWLARFGINVEGWVTPPFGDIRLINLAQAFTAI